MKPMTLAVHTTSVCTLKCKKCGNCFPMFREPWVADVNITLNSIEKCFDAFGHIRELRFAGGEAFLYKDLEYLLKKTAKYASKIDYGIIVTNGTYLPSSPILDTISKLPYRMIVRVDHYGTLSTAYDELVKLLMEKKIEVDERKYFGDDQAFGGWLDLGDCSEKHYPSEKLDEIFARCHMLEAGMTLYEDKLYDCCYAASLYHMGVTIENPEDVIDLSDKSGVPSEMIAERYRNWRKTPFKACEFCNGYIPDGGIRIPAAEQMERII